MPNQGRTKGQTVRVQAPDRDKGMSSGRLFIGRGLYDAIGRPARINLYPDGAHVRITAGTEYTIVGGRASGTQPRISLGESARELLGLDAGAYPAEAIGERIVVHRVPVPVPVPVPAPALTAPPGCAADASAIPALTATPESAGNSHVRIRGARLLLRGRVSGHHDTRTTDNRPAHAVTLWVGGADTVEVISTWTGVPDHLPVGARVEIEIEVHRTT